MYLHKFKEKNDRIHNPVNIHVATFSIAPKCILLEKVLKKEQYSTNIQKK